MRYLLPLFCFIFLCSIAKAQWSEIAAIDDNNLYQIYNLQDGRMLVTAERGDMYLLNQFGEFTDTIDLQEYGFLRSKLSTEGAEYVGGGCYFVTNGCPGHALYRSTDGGSNWEEVDTEITFTGFGNIVAILPFDKDHILVIKEYEGLFTLNKTTGAVSRVKIPPLDGAINFMNGIHSDDGKWAIQLSRTELGRTRVLVFESSDLGLTWDQVKLADEWDNALSIAYRKDNSLQLIGSTMKVFKYRNGRTDLISTISIRPFEQVNHQYIIDKNHSYVSSFDHATRTGFIYRSSDGGRTWEVDLSQENSFFDQMIFKDRNNGFLISGNRRLLKREGPLIQDFDQELVLFPNPVRSELCFNLAFDRSPEYQVLIHDLMGREMINTTISSPIMNVSVLETGIYILSILDINGDQKAFAKFCKQ